MKCKIIRTHEGFEIIQVYEPIETEDPNYVPFGTIKTIVNPSTNETITPVLPGVAYGWLMAPSARKVPLIVDNYTNVPPSTESLGFSKRSDSASAFTVTTADELREVLLERYSGTLNETLVTNASADNYIGPFFSNIVTRLLKKEYTPFESMRPQTALVLYADDVKTGFTLFNADKGGSITAASRPTFNDVISGKDCPSNIYIAPDDLQLLRKYLFDEVDDSFSHFRKNCILLAATCFCPEQVKFSGEVTAPVDSNGYLVI